MSPADTTRRTRAARPERRADGAPRQRSDGPAARTRTGGTRQADPQPPRSAAVPTPRSGVNATPRAAAAPRATPRATQRAAATRRAAPRRRPPEQAARATGLAPRRSRTAVQRPQRRPRVRTPRPLVAAPRRRQLVVLGLVAVVLVTLGVRLVYVQTLAGPALAAEALGGRMHTEVIPAERGQIVDRSGVVLATSVERWNIVVNQQQLAGWKKNGESAADAAALLAPLLGVPAVELGPKLIGDAEFAYLSKGVAPEVYEQVMDLGILGISGEQVSERLYPNGTTAGNVLGFVGTDGYGLAGLEQVYDDTLAGEAGSDTYERGEDGQRIPTGAEELVPASPGGDVQLTIARDLQYSGQQALDAQVLATGAEWGTLVVMNVHTGEVLVLADSGAIDPNDPQGNAAASRAVSYTYEPGSTAKVISMAAILEEGVATPTSPFVVPDRYTAPGLTVPFKDSHDHAPLNLTLTGILAESSNTGTVMVGQNLPVQVRHDYLAKFGFGSRTGIGLPGETGGLLHPADEWDGRSQYAVLFGQSVGTTTIQNAQVFATLANHGVRVQPHVVSAAADASGVMQPVQLEEPRQVVSAQTADAVVRMMESAVTEGTGGNAAVPGYRIAGKTGTAQAFEPGGVVKVVASFIGVAPADDPEIVVSVVLYNPKSSIYGGTVAAPVFSEVTAHALQYLGVPPSGVPADLFPITHG